MERQGGANPKLEPHQATAPHPILGAHFNMLGLSDIERILLVSDGTFTYQLETFVREPIGVEILSNRLLPLTYNAAALLNRSEGSFGLESSNATSRARIAILPMLMPSR